VLERHDSFGREASSRNSEVLHAGLYYAPEMLRTRLCLEGRREIYRLAAAHGIPHRKCGKLVVAVEDSEVPGLEKLLARGCANGVEGLEILTQAEVRRREPNVVCRAALLSPETGIVDSHRLMEHFKRGLEAAGGSCVFGCEVTGLAPAGALWRLRYRDSGGDGSASCRAVVNCAGLGAQAVMTMAGLDPEALDLRLHLCKGDYFSVQGPKRALVRSLVYPAPERDLSGLGIHTVVDLGGGLKLGPSARYVNAVDYTVDAARRADFCGGARSFLPFLEPDDLAPDMSGVRAKLSGPGQPVRDFHIAHETAAGAPGFFNLAGIESPGLTASPAIARLVAGMVGEYLG
jgi:L-2-hydroxyglutarate oxidase LhgO